MSEFIINGDFVAIKTNKFKKEFGVAAGDLAYIAGHRALPISEKDPYTQRIKFIVALCDDEGHVDVSKHYLMDAKSLKKVSDEVVSELRELFEKDFNRESDATVN